MRTIAALSVILATLSLGCESLSKRTAQPEPEIYLKPTTEKTEFVVVQGASGDQIIDLMQRYLKPRLYKQVASPVTSNQCEYIYTRSKDPSLGSCPELVRPTCFQLIESIRKSILSKQEVEMTTHICAGKSRIKDAVLLEIVYGDQQKWSGHNASVNAQKEFAELKDTLAEQIGAQKVQFVRRTTASRAQP